MAMSPKDELERAHRQATFIGMAMISSLIIYVIILFRSVNISTLLRSRLKTPSCGRG